MAAETLDSPLQWTLHCTNCGDIQSGEMDETDWMEIYHLFKDSILDKNLLTINDECDHCAHCAREKETHG